MDKQAAIRRVRIAVSVFFGVLTVALCVLWVRSYFNRDSIEIVTGTRLTTLVSEFGVVAFRDYQPPLKHAAVILQDLQQQKKWFMSYPVHPEDHIGAPKSIFGFGVHRTDNQIAVSAPVWFLVILTALAAYCSGLRRFSLQMLLIATTLFAAVLGLGVWLVS